MTLMRRLRKVPPAVWTAAGVIVVLAAVLLAGYENPNPPPPVTTDALGPGNSESLQQYLRAADASLSPQDGDSDDGSAPRWAMVSFEEGTAADGAAQMVAPVRISEVLTHVPLDGTQTPVTATQTPATGDPAATVGFAQKRAAEHIAERAGEASGRGGAVAQVTGALRGGCDCVVALIVRGDLERLRTIEGRPGVRAVEALPPDAVFGSFAVRPLTPGTR